MSLTFDNCLAFLLGPGGGNARAHRHPGEQRGRRRAEPLLEADQAGLGEGAPPLEKRADACVHYPR